MTERPLPSYHHMASCCRHAAATAEPHIRTGLEEAAAALDYLGERPELVRAIAFFAADPAAAEVLKSIPAGTKISALNGFGDRG